MTLQMGKNQPRRPAEHTPRQPPGPVSYWLIFEKRNNSLEVLTLRTDDEQETLPVFSSEEEAKIILQLKRLSIGLLGCARDKPSGTPPPVRDKEGVCAFVLPGRRGRKAPRRKLAQLLWPKSEVWR